MLTLCKFLYAFSGSAAVGMFCVAPFWIFGLPGQDNTEYARRWAESLHILLTYPCGWLASLLAFLMLRKLDAPHRAVYLVLASAVGSIVIAVGLTRLSHVLNATP